MLKERKQRKERDREERKYTDFGETTNGFNDTASGAIEGPVLSLGTPVDSKYMKDKQLPRRGHVKPVEDTSKEEEKI